MENKRFANDVMKSTRREFLYNSGVLLASTAIAPGLSAAVLEKNAGSKDMVRIGVVGGGFGAAFYWHLHLRCIVEAASDLRPDRREILQNVYKPKKMYNSLEEMVKDKDIDAIAVFTGAPDHVKHSVLCLKHGKHVISAVPAAINLKQCEQLLDAVQKTGLTYMMAETSYYQLEAISARKFFREGKFGSVFYTEAEYHHAGLDVLFHNPDGSRSWRYGYPPMLYPTHATAFIPGITGEKLTQVSCVGWGNDSQYLKDNDYKNPFLNETAFFTTDKGNCARIAIYWHGAHKGCERAQWYGDKMSFFMHNPNGIGPVIVRSGPGIEKDEAGFERQLSEFEPYQVPEWHKTDMLPESLRFFAGHGGAEPFLTHEFIDALVNKRRPSIDIYEALDYTVPGIIAHESALKGGKQLKIPQFSPKG